MGISNRDWLFSLPLEEQYAWMNAEHQDGTLDGDTAALNAKIAYPMHHGYKGAKADMVIFDELHDEHDSREKLEVEASELVADYAASGEVCDPMYNGIIELLDRQAAITAEETSNAWEEYRDATQREIAELTAERDQLQEQLNRTTSAMNRVAGKWAKTDAELRNALDIMRIWISDDAHLGESAISYEFEKAEGLRKLESIKQSITITIGGLEAERDNLKANNEQLHTLAGEQAAKIDELQSALDAICANLSIIATGEPSVIADIAIETIDALIDECNTANRQCNEYRNKFCKCIDHADAIHALMDDEGLA